MSNWLFFRKNVIASPVVHCLLHFDESTFVDSSAFGHFVAMGDATRDSLEYWFGGFSAKILRGFSRQPVEIYFSPFLHIGLNSDWSLDFWFKTDTLVNSYILSSNSGPNSISLFFNSSTNNITAYDGQAYYTFYVPVGANHWNHFEFSRIGGRVYFFVDGTNRMNEITSILALDLGNLVIGGDGFNSDLNLPGNIDEFRFQTAPTGYGLVGHTSNFTPPTAAYPNP
jgi:hypothetical protein